jgi:hypothetical protein
LEIERNPKELIEKNDVIFNNLIKNLYIKETSDEQIKPKIWNILNKYPKNIFINSDIKKYGDEKMIEEKDLKNIFTTKEIYIFTYTLQCIKEYINDEDKKNLFLKNFINIHHGDELLYKELMNIDMNPKNCKLIDYECLDILLYLIQIIENYKKEIKNEENIIKKLDINKLFNKISLIIIDLLQINFDILYTYSHYNHFDIIDNVDDEENFITKKINKMIFDLLENIINSTDNINEKIIII